MNGGKVENCDDIRLGQACVSVGVLACPLALLVVLWHVMQLLAALPQNGPVLTYSRAPAVASTTSLKSWVLSTENRCKSPACHTLHIGHDMPQVRHGANGQAFLHRNTQSHADIYKCVITQQESKKVGGLCVALAHYLFSLLSWKCLAKIVIYFLF